MEGQRTAVKTNGQEYCWAYCTAYRAGMRGGFVIRRYSEVAMPGTTNLIEDRPMITSGQQFDSQAVPGLHGNSLRSLPE
jgi:hypothetical protein